MPSCINRFVWKKSHYHIYIIANFTDALQSFWKKNLFQFFMYFLKTGVSKWSNRPSSEISGFFENEMAFSFILGLSLYVTKSFFFLTCYKNYGITKPFLWNYWKTMAEKLSMQESEISEHGWFEYLKNHMIITFDKNA